MIMTDESIIDAVTLRRRIGEPRLVLVDVRPRSDWSAGTIPGALSLDVYDYFISRSDEAGIDAMARAASRAMRGLGLDRARTSVFFEAQTGMISPRGLWFHELLGHEGGLILDGGIEAWKAAGGPIAPGAGARDAIDPRRLAGSSTPFCRNLVASIDEAGDCRRAGTDLLDVRRRSEFEGTFVHPCCARPGRIPDAKFLFWEDFLEDGHYRDAADIAERARAAGLSKARPIITYCHRGARAATALYGLRLAGFEARIFVGSWHEWAGEAGRLVCVGA
jgi:thiosulfate/3-mercaptopyruvate sulfurtransferase